jgi:hypothetical protein
LSLSAPYTPISSAVVIHHISKAMKEAGVIYPDIVKAEGGGICKVIGPMI